jgi:hypothetical protein
MVCPYREWRAAAGDGISKVYVATGLGQQHLVNGVFQSSDDERGGFMRSSGVQGLGSTLRSVVAGVAADSPRETRNVKR